MVETCSLDSSFLGGGFVESLEELDRRIVLYNGRRCVMDDGLGEAIFAPSIRPGDRSNGETLNMAFEAFWRGYLKKEMFIRNENGIYKNGGIVGSFYMQQEMDKCKRACLSFCWSILLGSIILIVPFI